MTKHIIELGGSFVVTKGPRDKSWEAMVEIDLDKLSPEIVTRLAFHGLTQKLADAAANSKDEDSATAAMQKAADGILAGNWKRRASDGVSLEKAIGRSLVRAAMKAQFGAKSPEWAKFIGLSDDDQNEKLDENFDANRAHFEPLVSEKIAERKRKAAEKKELVSAVSFKL